MARDKEQKALYDVTRKEYKKLYYEKNKEKLQEEGRDYRYKTEFGITLKQYNEMLEDQQGLCAICGKPEQIIWKSSGAPKNLAVDHCHTTGKVRALLCHPCNVLLGNAKESIETLNRAINYLEKHSGN